RAGGAAAARISDPVGGRSGSSFALGPPGPGEVRRRSVTALAFAPWLVEERGGVVRGYAYASKRRERAAYQWSVDVGVYVDEEHRRSGVGKALYGKLFRLLRLQGFYAAHAGVTLPNAASVGLHESLGFRPVGVYRGVGYKLGGWRDVRWWQLELRDRPGDPSPPKPTDEMQSAPRWGEQLGRREGIVRQPVPSS